MAANYVLKSKNIFDSVKDVPFSGNVVIEGKTIIDVCSDDAVHRYIGADTEIIDYGDKIIMPGFIDSHMHAGSSMDYFDESYCINVESAHTFKDVMELMQEFDRKYPENSFVLGINFNFFNLTEYFVPTAKEIDKYFPDKPALILTWDTHTYYVNTKAMEAAGVSKDTPDPNGGIEKDENGEPTGVFNDTAAFELMAKVTERGVEDRKKSWRVFQQKLNSVGITSIGDVYPCGTSLPYELYRALEDELSVRIHFYPELISFDMKDLDHYKQKYNSEMLQFAGLKNLIDGVLTVWTAWMLEPYANKPDTCGFPAVPAEQVKEKIMEACAAGCNVRIHTIGDRAIRYILDCFEEAKKRYGKLERHHCMEHIEYINPSDIPRFAELGIVADMQFDHAVYYVDDAVRFLGEERLPYCFNWRSIKDTGAIMGTGTDFPVVLNVSPMLGLYTAVTRKRGDGYPEGGWLPEQCLTLSEAVKVYTAGSAAAINREKDLGTLEVGKLADITVLERNIFDVGRDEIKDVLPVMTMVNGEIVYKV